MEPFLDKGRNVTTDNFFTSLSLAKRLLERKTTILGTVNKIRREIPPSTRRMDRNEFTTQLFSTTGATLTVYTPKRKKAVYILSSMHNLVQTEDTTKRKPNTVTLYNTTKCGVDIMDQMVREYSVRSGTRRWPVGNWLTLTLVQRRHKRKKCFENNPPHQALEKDPCVR
uniref:PiggyBac transposable element-derived protein domain-containing protein n=1 Tax=Knipowitschia caucasica TaxID=637954 RepID=A0AAV2L2K5_KNICA